MGGVKSRKLWVTILVFIVVTALLCIDKLNSQQYIDFAQWLMVVYVGGNVGSKLTRKEVKGDGMG